LKRSAIIRIRSFETSVHTKTTLRQIPEDGILHSHRREKTQDFTKLIFAGRIWVLIVCKERIGNKIEVNMNFGNDISSFVVTVILEHFPRRRCCYTAMTQPPDPR
jgi:hypothetical protein